MTEAAEHVGLHNLGSDQIERAEGELSGAYTATWDLEMLKFQCNYSYFFV